MNKRLHSIVRSELMRNSAKLLSANIVAQAIGLLVYPILTRIYAPEDFGLLNLFLSIGGVLVLFATAEYQYAIVLPKEEEKARALVRVCGIILLSITAIALLSVCFSKPIARLFNTPELANWYWLLPLFVLTMGTWNILNYWYIRRKVYGRISGYQVGQSAFSSASKLGLGAMGCLQGGMILSTVFAQLLSGCISIALAWKQHISCLFREPRARLITVLREYRNFPIYALPRSVINMVACQLPVLLLTPIFGTKEIGYWSMGILLAFAPINMINKTIYQVLYQHVTAKVNAEQKISGIFRQFTIGTLCLVIPAFCLLSFFLPALCEWLLGAGWERTGEYIRWMLPWLCGSMLMGSTGFLADVFFKQRVELFWEILMALLRAAGILAGIWTHDFAIAVIGYAIGSAIAVFTRYIWMLTLVGRYDKSLTDKDQWL